MKEIKDVVDFAADVKLKNLKIDDNPYFEEMFIDEDEILEDVKDEYKKFILDLIDKIDFSYLGGINFENKPELKIEQSEMKMKIYKILIPPLSQ